MNISDLLAVRVDQAMRDTGHEQILFNFHLSDQEPRIASSTLCSAYENGHFAATTGREVVLKERQGSKFTDKVAREVEDKMRAEAKAKKEEEIARIRRDLLPRSPWLLANKAEVDETLRATYDLGAEQAILDWKVLVIRLSLVKD